MLGGCTASHADFTQCGVELLPFPLALTSRPHLGVGHELLRSGLAGGWPLGSQGAHLKRRGFGLLLKFWAFGFKARVEVSLDSPESLKPEPLHPNYRGLNN